MDMRKQIALFRFEVIAPLLAPDPAGRKLKQRIEERTKVNYTHPSKQIQQVRFSTLEEWYYRYKQGGLSALEPIRRRDRGVSRSVGDSVAEIISELVNGHRRLTVPALQDELKARKLPVPSKSSLYRFLNANGLKTPQPEDKVDHRAYAFEFAGDCWQCDVMYGPHLPDHKGYRRRTYLIVILDDATRMIMHAQFYFEQDLRALKDVLKQALLKRGVPKRLYVDNGRIFRSRALLLATATLGIHLIHSGPYRPEGRAKGERFFGTVRRGFLIRVDPKRTVSLDELNRLLFAWIETKYHHAPHRGLDGRTPWDRWAALSEHVRVLPSNVELDWIFLEQAKRRVAKDGTLSVKGKLFEAGPDFIGGQYEVRFDPYDLRRVWLVQSDDKRHMLLPVDLHANARGARRKRKPRESSAPSTPALLGLDHLAEDLENEPFKF